MTCPTPGVARLLVPLVSAALFGLSACQDTPLLPVRTRATRSITVGAVPSTPLTVPTRRATPTAPELLGIDQAVITDFFRDGQVRSLLSGATPAVAYLLDGDYYVLVGHHRVASVRAAGRRGWRPGAPGRGLRGRTTGRRGRGTAGREEATR